MQHSKQYVQAIWQQVSERFAEYNEKLVFETLNEPRHIGTDHEWWIDITWTGEYAKGVLQHPHIKSVGGWNSDDYYMRHILQDMPDTKGAKPHEILNYNL